MGPEWRPSESVTVAPTGEVTASTWDHDHCELCFQEFRDEEHASSLPHLFRGA